MSSAVAERPAANSCRSSVLASMALVISPPDAGGVVMAKALSGVVGWNRNSRKVSFAANLGAARV